jgi:glycine/D-amino acid oxidase-like deaminating enzyme
VTRWLSLRRFRATYREQTSRTRIEKEAMTRHEKRRVAVLGGGILGASTAVAIARQRLRVTLFAEGTFCSGASGRSLAWLNSYGRRSPEYQNLRLLGLDRYRTFASRVDGSASYLRFDGGLTWPAPDELDDRRATFEHMRRVGYAAQWVTAEEVAHLTLGVDVSAIPAEGAIFNPQEGWVELPRLVAHLVHELEELGGEVRTDTGRCEVRVDRGRVTGVRIESGEVVGCDTTVLATGAEVPRTLAGLGVDIPDATSLALLVRTPAYGTSLRAVLNTPGIAVRPTPTGGLVLDSAWGNEQVVVRDDGIYEIREETVHALLEETSAVLEGNPRLTCESYGVGPKPIPGDGDPVLGCLTEIEGLHVAFTHSGATLGLIAGELIADEIVHDAPHPLLDPFRPSRFARRAAASV